jgi:mRNA-degrading endonuclease YafQ of YafQ-DinJ toxin-antitoxin module
MRSIETTPRFEKVLVAFIRKHPQLRDVVKKTMFRIASGEHTSLAVHPLKGSMKGYFSARLSHA